MSMSMFKCNCSIFALHTDKAKNPHLKTNDSGTLWPAQIELHMASCLK